jgi:transcriptional regulator with XRE-family HTH domain
MTAFAARLGVAQSVVSRYESGKLNPSRSMLLLMLPLAEGEERESLLDALGVDRDLQEGWAPGELEAQLLGFESFLAEGGRRELQTKCPRREFIQLAKELAGGKEGIPLWLVETLRFWRDHRGNREMWEFFEHVPIYLEVQLKSHRAGKAPPDQAGRRGRRK